MAVLVASVEPLKLGQSVRTTFGRGVISAISKIDSIVYVSLVNCSGLYIFRPEQVEPEDSQSQNDGR
ncbi:MAG TPA: hypothetical protein VKM94_22945 [Blastocatellia bacterium]|nr:hypothetical protein [Blastocatellia bacterium]